MRAADARQLVQDLGADDAVQKVAADAPALSDEQRLVLRGILQVPDATKAALAERPSSSLTDSGHPRRGLRAS